ncbi:MAG: flagellar hook-basal body complex protein FliE [Pseudomonadota bacterium]
MQVESTLASRLYKQAQGATQPGEAGGVGQFADSFYETMRAGEETAKAGLTGTADPQSVVEALAATELAVETAVTVRDRVVEAYQEILRMPV